MHLLSRYFSDNVKGNFVARSFIFLGGLRYNINPSGIDAAAHRLYQRAQCVSYISAVCRFFQIRKDFSSGIPHKCF